MHPLYTFIFPAYKYGMKFLTHTISAAFISLTRTLAKVLLNIIDVINDEHRKLTLKKS